MCLMKSQKCECTRHMGKLGEGVFVTEDVSGSKSAPTCESYAFQIAALQEGEAIV